VFGRRIDSRDRLRESAHPHPLGTTASPLGYYEYRPPGYGSGAKKPLLIFLHGFGENGDGTSAQLPNVISNSGIAYYIANNGWAADRPFVVLAPQHNFIESPAYPIPATASPSAGRA
jgi:predicted peptidase